MKTTHLLTLTLLLTVPFPALNAQPFLSLPKGPFLSLSKGPALSLPKGPALSLPKGPAPLGVAQRASLSLSKGMGAVFALKGIGGR